MNTSIILSLDQRRAKKDGTYPLIFRLSHFSDTRSIPVKRSILPEFWDEDKRRVRSHYRGTESPQRLNNYLTKSKAALIDKITALDERGELAYLSIAQLKDILTGKKHSKTTFYTFTQGLVDDLYERDKIGLGRMYKGVLSVIKTFTKGRDFPFRELNLDFIHRFERWHLAKNDNGLGGLSAYLRTIRAIYNKAVKLDIAERDASPFLKYTIRNGKPHARAIEPDLIRAIKTAPLTSGTTLERDRNIFMLSFYFRGMSYTDLAHLRRSDFVDGRIFYARQKTETPITVAINEQAWDILEYFGFSQKAPHEYILPIIQRHTAKDQYADVMWARKRFNKNLKKIADITGIEETLTSYVARHSFASIADEQDIPLTVISGMLGHQRMSTTQAYLKQLSRNRLDTYQNEVTSRI